jgi:hypothetical protein
VQTSTDLKSTVSRVFVEAHDKLISEGGSVRISCSQRPLLLTLSLFVVAACSSAVPHEGGEHLAISIHVTSGCPSYDRGHEGAANAYQGSQLVPPNPSAGLICRYEQEGSVPQSEAGRLNRQSRLNGPAATELVVAIRSLRLRPAGSAASCTRVTPDTGVFVALALSYPDGPDVSLWYRASGCVTVYNGRWKSVPAGNPGFSTFEEVINDLSPPI